MHLIERSVTLRGLFFRSLNGSAELRGAPRTLARLGSLFGLLLLRGLGIIFGLGCSSARLATRTAGGLGLRGIVCGFFGRCDLFGRGFLGRNRNAI